MDYSSIFKPRGANVRNLVLQNSSLLSGSDGISLINQSNLNIIQKTITIFT